MPFELNCQQCNKIYFVKKRKEVETSKYCSVQCFYDNRARLVIINGETQKRCSKCGEVKPFSEYHKNTRSQTGARAECKTCQASYMQKYVKDNLEHRVELARNWRNKNKEYFRGLQRNSNAKLRIEVLNAYGNKCVCCGETEIQFLAIDHVFNDGAEHRKEVGNSTQFYRWLKRNNFPKERFQILCHNCNMAKNLYGICPHEKTRHEAKEG